MGRVGNAGGGGIRSTRVLNAKVEAKVEAEVEAKVEAKVKAEVGAEVKVDDSIPRQRAVPKDDRAS